jgi:hypothetical protein
MPFDPFSCVEEASTLLVGDGTVCFGTHIQQVVAVVGDNADEVDHDVFTRHVLVVLGGCVEAKGEGVKTSVALELALLEVSGCVPSLVVSPAQPGSEQAFSFMGQLYPEEEDLLRSVEIARDTATVVPRNLSSVVTSPIRPFGKDLGRPVRSTNVAPYNLGLVIVHQNFHLGILNILEVVIDFHIASELDGFVSVGIGGWPAIVVAFVVLIPAIFDVGRIEPLGQAEVCSLGSC